MSKLILLVGILIFLGAFLFWLFTNLSSGNKKSAEVNLSVWGFEEEQAVKPTLVAYQASNPNVKITYTKQALVNYRTRVQTQIREGVGPDVFLINSSWLPMFEADIVPLPGNIMGLSDYKKTFIPLSVDSFVKDDQVYGLPKDLDGLVLFVNSDILAGAAVAVPKNWREFVEAATKVTVKDTDGQIKTAGGALGSTKNIQNWSQILGLLMLQQPGVDMKKVNSTQGAEALRFYTGFILDPNKKTWDVNLSSDKELFTNGKLAFYFGNFNEIAEFQAKNPVLKFQVVPVPQLLETPVAWGTIWAQTVSVKSTHPNEAWQLAKYLTSNEVLKNSDKPTARLDIIKLKLTDPTLAPFLSQAPYYKTWYLESNTQDTGLNDEMIQVWEVSIERILKGQNPGDAANTLADSTKEILDKYGVK